MPWYICFDPTNKLFIVEICEDVIQILCEADNPDPSFRLWITTEKNKVIENITKRKEKEKKSVCVLERDMERE